MENSITVAIIIALIGSNGFWAWLTYRQGKKSARNKLILALAHDSLYRNCTEYIKEGSIETDALENLTILYEAYHEMGGNGTGTKLYERCAKLPIKEI